jgi:hypothetical protein
MNEFVEALDVNEEEKGLKMDFLNNLHNIRSGYRNKMEEFKKKQ